MNKFFNKSTSGPSPLPLLPPVVVANIKRTEGPLHKFFTSASSEAGGLSTTVEKGESTSSPLEKGEDMKEVKEEEESRSGKKRKRVEEVTEGTCREGHDEVGGEDTWECIACTFMNHNALPSCEICETVKGR